MTAPALPDLNIENHRKLRLVAANTCRQTSGGLTVYDVGGNVRRINLTPLIAAGLIQLNGVSAWVTTPAGDAVHAAWQSRPTVASRFLNGAVTRRGI